MSGSHSALREIADREARQRFRSELDRNFSVVAPAGAGKTRAIVERIVALAQRDQMRGTRDLARLVVVTYTNKAAEEMQQRARSALVERRVDFSELALFNRAFFGTIHSFCLQILQQHAHLLGLPSQLNALPAEDALWAEFARYAAGRGDLLSADEARCLRFVSLPDLFRLGREARPWWHVPEPGPLPEVDLKEVLAFEEAGRGRDNIRRFKQVLEEWHRRYRRQPDAFCGLPVVDRGGREFEAAADRALTDLKKWVARSCWRAAQRIAAAYRDYRLARGFLTYDDQIYLTHRLLREFPEVLRRVRRQELIVLLDEAQDTDPLQFDILLEITRPENAAFGWSLRDPAVPGPGRFCMVGDPQQSIYPDRADLDYYRRVREYLARAPHGEEIVFEVTFRCDAAIVTFINQIGPVLLHGRDGQAQYVRLQPRPDCGPGHVLRLIPPPPENSGQRIKVADLTLQEAEWLAGWLRETGHEALGAPDWSGVAILCQQRKWLAPLAAALEREGFKTQVHSPSLRLGDHPAYAWLTALLQVLTQPDDTFNCVGVLREIFGISDELLYQYARGRGDRFRLDRPPERSEAGPGEVAAVLDLLRALRQELQQLPLREAVGRVMERTELHRRAAAVHPAAAEVDQQVRTLLGKAVDAERRGLSLREFVRELLEERSAAVEPVAVEPGAVQILTCHKAKGLQWDAVLLPLFFRPAYQRQEEYPVLLRASAAESPTILLDRKDRERLKHTLRRHSNANMQRLLYVALSRARRTLVIVDDREYFTRAGGGTAFGGLLEEDGCRLLETLPTDLRPAARPARGEGPPEEIRAHPVGSHQLAAARENAARIRERILPSLLAAEAPAEEPEWQREVAAEVAEAAREYGTWWHHLMETMPWSLGRRRWQEHFALALRSAPDRQRARREWDLFLRSELAQRLAQSGQRVITELPFLLPQGPERCMEGFMDLAQYDPARNTWLVVDWKTNLVAEGGESRLAAMYRPQIEAYAEALRRLTGAAEVQPALYSTPLGRLIYL